MTRKNPRELPGLVYGYVRVSTAMQADVGESLEVQQRKLDGWALQAGVQLAKVYVERGVSGGRRLEDRPEGKTLLSMLKPGDTVVASKLDRVFRSASDALRVLEDFKQRGIDLVLLDLGSDSCTGNGISSLIFTVLAAVADFERGRIAERISETKRHLRDRDRFLGGTRPFGYRTRQTREHGKRVKVLEPVKAEQRAITIMRSLRREGRSLRVIASDMQAKGFRLSHVAVQRILQDPPGRRGES